MTSVSEKINQGIRIKSEGNKYFKDHRYKKAIVTYNKVFAFITGLGSSGDAMSQYSSALNITLPTDKEQEEINELSVTCFSNISNCYLKLNEMEKTVEYCTKAIAINQAHLKSIFRKGQALLKLKYFDESRACLEKALSLDPENVAIKREFRTLNSIIKCRNEESKQKLKKSMGNIIQNGF